MRAVSGLGIAERMARDIVVDLRTFGGRLALITLASLLAPLMEVGFLTALYGMVAPDQRTAVLGQVRRWGLRPAWDMLGGDPYYVAILAGAAAAFLGAALVAKFAAGYLRAFFLLHGTVTQTRRVVSAYLYASPAAAGRLPAPRVGNAVVVEAAQYGRVVFALLNGVSNLAGAGLFMLIAVMVAPGLVLLGAVLAILTVVIVRRGFARQKALGTARVAAQTALLRSVWELLNGYRTIKIEAAERRVLHRFWTDLRTRQVWRLDKARNELFITLGSETVLYVGLLAVILLSAAVLRVEASVILMFLLLMSRLQRYLSGAQAAWVEIQHWVPSLAAIAEIIETCEASAARPPRPRDGVERPQALRLAFEDVRFGYDGGEPILEGCSLALDPGDRVLIQGPSGEGKSTLLFLACGLLQPGAGIIRMNGRPLTEEVFYRTRPVVAYVAPDVYLFRGCIRDNLCLGWDYPEAEILRAVERAQLGELVARLPGGLDADIGDDGAQISLGERQRVMLARIFLKAPLLVLLDEATANLDLDTEERVLAEMFENLPAQAIVVMVTHRAPVGVSFTRVFDLSEGRLHARAPAAAGTPA